MLSRVVLLAQVVELSLYAAAGIWLRCVQGCAIATIVAAAIAAALGIRLAIVCFTFAYSWLHRSPRPPGQRIAMAAAFAMVLREWRSLVILNFVFAPWERWALRPDPAPAPRASPAIVMVHGYFVNRGCFHALLPKLERAGLGPVFAPNLRSWLAPIERCEEELAEAIERTCDATGQPVVIVAHSMGGLAARLYLARHGPARVAKLITIASPHHGTAHAMLGLGENASQMRRGSAFLVELERLEAERPPSLPATSIYTAHDNLVAPQETSRLAWAKNVVLSGLGHLDILESSELLEALLDELDEAGVRPRAA